MSNKFFGETTVKTFSFSQGGKPYPVSNQVKIELNTKYNELSLTDEKGYSKACINVLDLHNFAVGLGKLLQSEEYKACLSDAKAKAVEPSKDSAKAKALEVENTQLKNDMNELKAQMAQLMQAMSQNTSSSTPIQDRMTKKADAVPEPASHTADDEAQLAAIFGLVNKPKSTKTTKRTKK